MNFLLNNEEAIQIVNTFFIENDNLKQHYWTWLRQLDVKAIQDMLMLCHFDPKGLQYTDTFKNLF